MQVNWEQLEIELGQQLVGSLKGRVEGAAADLQAYGTAIASELTLALSTGDADGIRELKAQLGVLAETHRVAVAAERETLVLSLIAATINAATSGLLAAGADLGNILGA